MKSGVLNWRSVPLVLAYLVGCFTGYSHAQTDYCFSNVIPTNISNITDDIYAVKQDQQQNIWFGTKSGLIRFDGKNFIQIKEAPLYIRDIELIGEHQLAIASKQSSIAIYDNKTGRITPTIDQVSTGYSVDNNTTEGFWAGGPDFVAYYDAQNQQQYKWSDISANSLVSNDAQAYFVNDRPSKPMGLYSVSENGLSFIKPLSRLRMFGTQQGNQLWFEDKNKVTSFDVHNQQWYEHFDDLGLASLLETRSDTVWFNDFDGQLIHYDPHQKQIIRKLDLNKIKGISNLNARYTKLLLIDHQGTLWITDNNQLFTLRCVDYLEIVSLEEQGLNWIRTLAQSQNEFIWLGGTGGLIKYFKTGEVDGFLDFNQEIRTETLKQRVNQLLVDREYLWVLTSHQIYRIDLATEKWKKVALDSKPKALRGKILVWNNSLVLLATDGVVIDRDSLQVRKLENENISTKDHIGFTQLSEHLVGLSTTEEVMTFDLNSGKAQSIWNYGQRESSLKERNVIRSLTRLSENSMIGSSESGELFKIIHLDRANPQVEFFNKPASWPTSRELMLSELINNDVWLATRDALYQFDTHENRFNRFGSEYGIPEKFFNSNSALYANGKLYIGGRTEFLAVDITKLKNEPSSPKPIISMASLAGFDLLREEQSLQFSNSQNDLLLKFGSTEFRYPATVNYQIKLEVDSDWIELENRGDALFTELNAGQYSVQIRAKSTNGEWSDPTNPIRFSISPVIWQSSIFYFIYGLVLLLVFIATTKLRERRLKRYNEKLEFDILERTKKIDELLKRKNDLFAHISHELRTPLTLIRNPIKQIMDSKNKNLDDLIETAFFNTERLTRMVNQLLLLAKYNTPDLNQNRYVSIDEVIQFVVTSIHSYAENKRISMVIDCDNDYLIAQIDDSLETILLNLIVNAIKYSPRETEVRINVKRNQQNVLIEVNDQGPGIPDEYKELVFERFTQLEKDGRGVGLGLALVKELVDANNGTIVIDKYYQCGSQFLLSFPIVEDTNNACISKRISKIDAIEIETLVTEEREIQLTNSCDSQNNDWGDEQESRLTVLVVDDSIEMCSYIKSSLEKTFNCHFAFDGEEGFSKAKTLCPDVIVSDIMMPKADGMAMLRKIREEVATSHIPIIMFTAFGEDQVRLEAYRSLADDFFTKPFNDEELIQRINSLVEVRRLVAKKISSESNPLNLPKSNNKVAKLNGKEELFVSKLSDLVEKKYHQSEFTVSQLASAMHLTERTLQRKLKMVCDVSPKDYLRVYRLEKARALIESTHDSIESIALQVGFSNRTHFYRYFKDYTGDTPADYRRKRQTA